MIRSLRVAALAALTMGAAPAAAQIPGLRDAGRAEAAAREFMLLCARNCW